VRWAHSRTVPAGGRDIAWQTHCSPSVVRSPANGAAISTFGVLVHYWCFLLVPSLDPASLVQRWGISLHSIDYTSHRPPKNGRTNVCRGASSLTPGPPSLRHDTALYVAGASAGAVARGWHAPAHFPKKGDDTPCLRALRVPLHNQTLIVLPLGSSMNVMNTVQKSYQMSFRTHF